MNRFYKIFGFLLISFSGFAQFRFSATATDKTDNQAIPSVVYKITSNNADKIFFNGLSDNDGKILIPKINKGDYRLILSSVGYDSLVTNFTIKDQDLNLGNLLMKTSIILMQELKVNAKADRVTMKGDTTQFNADAYKVNPDANAEDLIKKMPGVEVENGAVKAQGENVRRVLIDGKEFFGNDPSMALKNLPAEIIDKIEVFDRQSDQSRFSGFDDGNTEKTINIVTKGGKSNGEFGKIYAGVGTEERYAAGGNVNYFKGDRRISLIGLSNNVNQVNFASEDLLGALGANANPRGGGSQRGGGGNRGGGSRGGGTDAGNFLVGNQGGITNTNAIGFNYIDKWSKKIEVSASYFFNRMANNALDSINRTVFTGQNSQQFYNEGSQQFNTNYNHRINSRITYEINTKNSLIFTPNLSFQGNDRTNSFSGFTDLANLDPINSIFSNQSSESGAYNLRANLTYRHRFEKRGRTVSLGMGANTQSSNSSGILYSENKTFLPFLRENTIDQINTDTTVNNGYTIRIDFTEPLNTKSQVNFSYNGSFSINKSDRRTLDLDESLEYTILNPILSNSFLNDYNTHAAGISYRYFVMRKFNVNVNVNFQQANLNSEQIFPQLLNVNRSFFNVLPFISLNYQFKPTQNLRFFYRSSSRAPSINQLQNVVNNSNPLQLRAGNPELDQQISNLVTLRYNSTNTKKATSFFAFVNAELVQNNISNSIFTAPSDTIFRGVLLAKGSQLTLPINYGNTWNIRSFLTYGFPLTAIKSNINTNFGISHVNTPTLVNGRENISTNNSLSAGIVVGSNISPNIDFTFSYSGAYNLVNNTVNPQLNSNFYSQLLTVKLNLLSKKGFFFNTEGVNTNFTSLGDDFGQVYTLFNFSLGQKFLKNQAAELKLTAFDVFNQNTSIGRTINEAFIEDTRSLVLNRYFLMTFTYNIRNFRK
jgi:hypothetical protein